MRSAHASPEDWEGVPVAHAARIAKALDTKVARAGCDECWPWQAGTTTDGYGIVSLYPHKWRPFAHRLAFLRAGGRLAPGAVVMHRCDNPRCCNPAHLGAGTLQDNNEDMFGKERNCRGSAHPNAKLTERDIPTIRADMRSNEDIGAAYGVSRAAIQHVKARKTWRHA